MSDKLLKKEFKHPHLLSGECVAISPLNNRFIAIATKDGQEGVASIYDMETSKHIHDFKGHDCWITSMKFSRDGKYLFTGSNDHSLKIWKMICDKDDSINSIKPIRTIKKHSGQIKCIDISSDNNYLVSASFDNSCKLFKLHKDLAGNISPKGIAYVRKFQHTSCVKTVAFTKDVKYIVSGSNSREIKVWNITTGDVLRTLKGHTGRAVYFATSFNNKYIVSGSSDGTAMLWNIITGERIKTFKGHSDKVTGVSISSDNSIIITASSDKTLKCWDTETSAVLETLEGHNASVNAVDLSPNNEIVASVSFYDYAKLWDIKHVLCKVQWYIVRPVVMLRLLSEKNRATMLLPSEEQELVDLLIMEANDDVFFYVLSFFDTKDILA